MNTCSKCTRLAAATCAKCDGGVCNYHFANDRGSFDYKHDDWTPDALTAAQAVFADHDQPMHLICRQLVAEAAGLRVMARTPDTLATRLQRGLSGPEDVALAALSKHVSFDTNEYRMTRPQGWFRPETWERSGEVWILYKYSHTDSDNSDFYTGPATKYSAIWALRPSGAIVKCWDRGNGYTAFGTIHEAQALDSLVQFAKKHSL